jgi:glutamate dehydrogenase
VQAVFNKFGLSSDWHDGKYVISILKSIPQDELFQFDENELYHLCKEILEIQNNKSLSLVLRPDPHGHYVSVLIYIPRELSCC